MSVRELLHVGLKAALEDDAMLAATLTGIFDAPPVRATRPFILIDQPMLTDWGTKDMAGREGRVTIASFDTGERAERLWSLTERVDAALSAMPRELGAGWAVASLVFLRGRIVREEARRWMATNEYRVRMLRSEV